MSRKVQLRELAHARSGDKGNRSNLCLFVYDPADYEIVKAWLTPERLKAAFGELLRGEIVRYELPKLHGFNFVMDQALEGMFVALTTCPANFFVGRGGETGRRSGLRSHRPLDVQVRVLSPAPKCL